MGHNDTKRSTIIQLTLLSTYYIFKSHKGYNHVQDLVMDLWSS